MKSLEQDSDESHLIKFHSFIALKGETMGVFVTVVEDDAAEIHVPIVPFSPALTLESYKREHRVMGVQTLPSLRCRF